MIDIFLDDMIVNVVNEQQMLDIFLKHSHHRQAIFHNNREFNTDHSSPFSATLAVVSKTAIFVNDLSNDIFLVFTSQNFFLRGKNGVTISRNCSELVLFQNKSEQLGLQNIG